MMLTMGIIKVKYGGKNMKIISDAAEYALRAVVWLAQEERVGGKFKHREIAEGTQAAPGYLIKALQSLVKAGILSAQRGSMGGFSLLLDARELTVFEVVNAVDPIERIRVCPLGLKSHGSCLCPMHQRMDDAMEAIETSLKKSTIQDLIGKKGESIPMVDMKRPG